MKLFDSRSAQKHQIISKQGPFKLYVCGLTVYDEAHIGHLRTMLVFDLLVRVLRAKNIDVTYVRNITDVDDKIIKRAEEKKIPWQALTTEVIDGIKQQEQLFTLIDPDHEPKASEYIEEMIEMIAVLEQKGFAYVNTDGDVCFKVSAYKDYGQLSKQNLMALEQSARIAQGAKESSHDFVLWKKSKPGEPTWHSPWGEGRPGWHIECSAMSTKLLGTDFDLHGGGLDLKFPHHENEIAQSCCAHGGGFAKHWMHVGPLRVNGEKMSKSLGNFITINDALKTHHPEVIRWYLLKTHYRMPMNYELDGLEQARKNILTMYQALQGEYKFDEHHPKYLAFIDQLEDDLNIAAAISMMHEFAASLQTPEDRGALWAMLQLIGVGMVDPDTYLHQGADQDKVEALLQERNSSRAQKDYQNADRIRDELSSMGVVIEDRPSGTHWFCQYAGQIKS